MAPLTANAKKLEHLQSFAALFSALLMAIAIGIALGFEKIGGFMPCKLCLEERIPYYIGIPLMLATALLSFLHLPRIFIRLLLIAAAILMFYNFGLSIYHAGAEYKFWQGPTDCSAAAGIVTTKATDLLASLNSVRPPACDTAAGYFLGLSFAGWNGVASLGIAVISLFAALWKRPRI